MNLISRYALLAALATAPALALGDDVSAVRKEIEALKQAYEARIEALEQKLKTLEREQAAQAARAPVPAPQPVAANSGQVTAGSAFNPQLSVILDGVFFTDDAGGDGGALPGEAYGVFHGHGHGHEHEHGGVDRGFNLRETEIAFSATVDPYFDAAAYFAVSSDGDFEVEEAFLASRSLPAGLRVKAGKFLSDIGYLNNQHPHQWDFVDQNLPYLNLLGPHGLNDTGVQVTWLPDWPVYTLFGVELLQGDQEKIGALVDDEDAEEVAADLGIGEGELGLSREDHGPRLYTAFAKVGPDPVSSTHLTLPTTSLV